MKRLATLIGATVLALGLAGATTPWRLPRSDMSDAITRGAPSGMGLRAIVGGPVTLRLLPRPRIQASELQLTADDGAVLVDAPSFKAEFDIPSLLRGSWKLISITLLQPTVTLDLDRLATRPSGSEDFGARMSAVQLRLRSGLLRTRSVLSGADLLATGLDATLTWLGDGDGVVFSGNALWRGTSVSLAANVQNAAQCLAPSGSAASVQIDSPLFSFQADGVVSGGLQEQFTGHASLSTPALPKMLRLFDGPAASAGVRRVQVSGDLVAKPHDLSLSNAQLRLDRTRLEGTLAWRRDAGRGLIVGTLATDLLDLDALMGSAFDRQDLDGVYRRPFDGSPFGTDIDLRVSAATARIGPLSVQDVAGAALARGDRLELSLDEASGYGGTVKARAVATLGGDGIDAHADLSASRLDVARLSDGLGGDGRVGGTVTGRASLDGHGSTFREVVEHLSGQGQLAIDGGHLAGLSLADLVQRLGTRLPLDIDRRGTPTTFDHAQWDATVADGVVRIPDGRLTAPGVAMTFGAEAALPDGRVDVHAVAAQTDGRGAPLRNGRPVPFDMIGSWTGPLVLVGRGLSPIGIPLFDAASERR